MMYALWALAVPLVALVPLAMAQAASVEPVAVFDFALIATSLDGEMNGPRADVIDMKDPAKGALGALEPAAVRAAVAAIAGRRPASAVTGDLPMQPDIIYSLSLI